MLDQSSAGDSVQSVPLTGRAFVGVVDQEALQRTLRQLFNNRELVLTKGLAARAHVLSKWSWDDAADVAEEKLHQLNEQGPRRPDNTCLMPTNMCEQKRVDY